MWQIYTHGPYCQLVSFVLYFDTCTYITVSRIVTHHTVVCLIPGPRCPVRCRDRTTAPAPAGEALTLNKENQYQPNRRGNKHSPKRRRPRSQVKLLPNSQPVPRGKT